MHHSQSLDPQNQPLYNKPLFALFFFTLMATGLLWVNLFTGTSFNFNVIYLTECAHRILAGGIMSEVCFDTNPPLSVIIYMPIVLAGQLLPAFSPNILFVAYILLICLSAAAALYYLIRKLPALNHQYALIFTFIFILANTALTGRFFGERDHLAFIGVFIFFFAQLTITNKTISGPSRLPMLLILTFSGLLILIKPHYGLIPFLMMLDRIRQWKTIKAIFQADIIILSVLCLIYAAILFIFFNDFIYIILPDIAPIYATAIFHEDYKTPFAICSIVLGLVWFALHRLMPDEDRPLLNRLFGIAAIALLIFLIQSKGWGYHLVPFISAFFCAVMLSLLKIAPAVSSGHKSVRLTTYSIFLAGSIAGFIVNPVYPYAPDHNAYRHYNLAEEIRRSPENEPCHFMMFAGMTEIQSLAYYNQCTLASRFSVIWFYSLINNYLQAPDDQAKQDALYALQPYAERIAMDLEIYKPHVVIGNNPDMMNALFSALGDASPRFKNYMDGYSQTKTLDNESPDYYAGTIYANKQPLEKYVIYKRNDLLDN
jgi:hypothetical protein